MNCQGYARRGRHACTEIAPCLSDKLHLVTIAAKTKKIVIAIGRAMQLNGTHCGAACGRQCAFDHTRMQRCGALGSQERNQASFYRARLGPARKHDDAARARVSGRHTALPTGADPRQASTPAAVPT